MSRTFASRISAVVFVVASLVATGLVGIVAPAPPAGAAPPACNIAWVGGNGNAQSASMWRTIPDNIQRVPNTGDIACITAAGTYTVTSSSTFTSGTWLVIGGSSGTQTLQITAGSVSAGNIAVGANAVVSLAGDGAAFGNGNGGEFTNAGVIESVGSGTGERVLGVNNSTLLNTGTIRANAPLSAGSIQNDGTITASAQVRFHHARLRANTGTITATGSGVFRFENTTARLVVTSVGVNGPVVMDGGFLEILGAGPLTAESFGTTTLVGDVRAGQSITLSRVGTSSGNLFIDDSAVNQGTITLRDAETQITTNNGAGDVFTNRGTISVPGAATGRQINRGFVNDTAGNVNVAGPLRIDPWAATFTNRGSIAVTGALTLVGSSTLAGGTIAATGGGTVTGGQVHLTLAGGAVTGAPVDVVASPSSVTFGGTAAATIRATASLPVSGTIAASQVLQVPSSATTPAGATFTNNGTVELLGTGSYFGNAAGTVVNNGLVRNTGGLCCPQLYGRWTNNGTITVPAGGVSWRSDEGFRSLTNNGTIDLAAGAQLTTPSFTQASTGQVITRITAPSNRGLLTIQGTATLAGQIRTVTTGTPPAGTTVTPVTFESRTGTLTVANGGGTGWTAAHGATSIVLTVSSTTPHQAFVRAAYQDFLDRPPTGTELSTAAAALDAGSTSRAAVVRSLSTSPEYVTALVQRLYVDTLGRTGDSGGVAYWVGELRSGRRTVAQVAASFYASPEYYTGIGGGTDASWVRDLYVKLLGRTAGAAEVPYWVGETVARGRTNVAGRFYQSIETRRVRVNRLYQALLGRSSDAAGRDYWAARILVEGDLALAANLASSVEYHTRAQVRFP